MSTSKKRYEISDEEWERVKDLLPSDKLEKQGRPPKPNRDMLNAILCIAMSGAPWRDLPERYGSWKTVYDKFNKWAKESVFEKVFEILNVDADMQELSIDSTSVKVHQHAAGAQKGQMAQTQTKI
jgi:transposase